MSGRSASTNTTPAALKSSSNASIRPETSGSSPSKKYFLGTPRRRPDRSIAGSVCFSSASTASSRATSATLRPMGPTVSRVLEIRVRPALGYRPTVGRKPTIPLRAAGMRLLPPVSVPSPATAMPVATATAVPPLLPPAIKSGSQAFPTEPNAMFLLVMPKASSCILVFPSTMAPAALRRATTGASSTGIKDLSAGVPAVFGMPAT